MGRAGTPAWYALESAAVAERLGSGPAGLTEVEANARLARYGPNEIGDVPPTAWWTILLRQFRSPLVVILLVAAAITLILGEFVDVAVIAGAVLLDVAIGFWQERQAETAVRSLARMVSPQARALRDGRQVVLPTRLLVPGDVVLLESGVRVPADIRLAATTALAIDESALTGESVPVEKAPGAVPPGALLAERTGVAHAGTVVTTGRGQGHVVATGSATELGAIASGMRATTEVTTPLERRMATFARQVGVAVSGIALLAVAIGLARGEPLGDLFLVAVALAVSAIPEGLPVATTIALAIGVRRMARRNAIVRHLPAVETLGSTTCIGSDKTGTLTENRMTVQEAWTAGRTVHLDLVPGGSAMGDAGLQRVLLAGVLTNEATATLHGEEWEITGDPTEAALLVAAHRAGLDPARQRAAQPLLADLPFESSRQFSASVREGLEGLEGLEGPATWVKGALERVLPMCATMTDGHGPVALDAEAIQAAAAAMARRGLRVLALATGPALGQAALAEPAGLTFLGLQGMHDPPRPQVREAIDRCHRAGIRTMMITGDYVVTALAIGRDLGIAGPGDAAIDGAALARMDDDALQEAVRTTQVFARVAPDQKLRVVRALQANGEVVAITGDGVNDAPALKAAEIGVAMGRGGTDVAREASDMVLTDDAFESIVAAVEEGRITFDNIRKVTMFLIGSGVAEVLAILLAILLGWPLPLVAAQILWLNLVTDGLQDIALAFEPGEPDALDRPPRARAEGLLSRLMWERVALSGLVMGLGTLAMFRWELERGGDLVQAQTVALTTMVVFQTFQAGNARSETRSLFTMNPFANRFLFLAAGAALLVHIGALHFPPAQYVLRVEPIPLQRWAEIVAMGLLVIVAVEGHKRLRREPAGRS